MSCIIVSGFVPIVCTAESPIDSGHCCWISPSSGNCKRIKIETGRDMITVVVMKIQKFQWVVRRWHKQVTVFRLGRCLTFHWHPPTWRLARVHSWYPWKLYPSDCSSVDQSQPGGLISNLECGDARALLRLWWGMKKACHLKPHQASELYDVVYPHDARADSYISHVSQQKEQGNLHCLWLFNECIILVCICVGNAFASIYKSESIWSRTKAWHFSTYSSLSKSDKLRNCW